MKCLLAVVLVTVPATLAVADDNPIVATVKAKLKDPAKPFTMWVTFKVKPGMAAKFEAAVAASVKGTTKEPGNVAYQLNHDPDHPEVYVLYERWKNLNALAAHVKEKHTEALLAALPDLLDGQAQIKVYHAVGE